MKMSL